MERQIRFCTSADGTRIACGTEGRGPPLVVVSSWGGNTERDWDDRDTAAVLGSSYLDRLAVTFDRRGLGASQREVDDFSLEAQVADVAAVSDYLQLDHFDLWGCLDGAAIGVAYAAQHPERVSRLVLWAPYPCGAEVVRPEGARGLAELIHGNWSLARRALADVSFPSGPTDLRRRYSRSLGQFMSPEVAAKCVEFYATVDVRPFLPQVRAPTLVLHRRGDRSAPLSAGRAVAALIPDARFLALEGDEADPFMGDTSHMQTMARFLDEGRAQAVASTHLEPSGFRTILFTDMESSTVLRQRLGDAKAQEVVRVHNTIVRDALKGHGGSEIKHTGDGIMASFPAASGALECAVAIQRGVAAHVEQHPETPLGVYIGLNAGEPIAEEADLFGTSVDLAARICGLAEAGEIVVSDVVRQLVAGKGFLFSDRGDVELRGFEDPVRLYEVRWRD